MATYRIYRSTTSGFTPGPANLIGQASAPAFSDGALSAGTYYYQVIAFDGSGNPSAASNQATATIAGSLQVDNVVFSDGSGTRTSPAISTATAGELLLAFAASDGPQAGGQTLTITGAGLTWTLVARMNTQPGSSEIWKAVAPGVLANATVTSTPSRTGFDQSLTVIAFAGAGGTGAAACGERHRRTVRVADDDAGRVARVRRRQRLGRRRGENRRGLARDRAPVAGHRRGRHLLGAEAVRADRRGRDRRAAERHRSDIPPLESRRGGDPRAGRGWQRSQRRRTDSSGCTVADHQRGPHRRCGDDPAERDRADQHRDQPEPDGRQPGRARERGQSRRLLGSAD